jgi:DNA-binding NarL/FixJ family response regulator
MTTVVIADDQELVRTGLRTVLENQADIVVLGEAADGQQVVVAAEALDPDVVLMDVQMPVMDGITATRQLAGKGDRPRVLVLTTFDLDEYVFEALRAGASGFLLKDSTPARLVTAIKAVAGGDSLFAPSVTRRLVEKYAQTPRLSQDVALGELTDREREVLALLAKGLSNAEISERLVVSLPTVKTHVGRVLSKLGLRDRVQAVVFAYEAGVVRVGEDP